MHAGQKAHGLQVVQAGSLNRKEVKQNITEAGYSS